MCGIAAIISDHREDHDLIRPMTAMLQHRGPDDHGYYQNGPASLGHRRLSIIDLSKAGAQPLFNEAGDISLVCNGEIYNYLQLRDELIEKGHSFSSNSDSEVLLHLYEEYGDNLLDHVNGMYAFAIWDEREQRLLAAVDRFGKKPIYYCFANGRMVLASEMKSLLLFPWVEKDIDPLAVDRYLTFRYIPAPLTILKSVNKMEASTLMVWKGNELNTRRYWKAEAASPLHFDDHTQTGFEELFSDAVRLRMQSDVPLGLYLSGGVDSAAVAGAMHNVSNNRCISYTLCVDYQYNEHDRSKQVADYLGFEFNPVKIDEEHFDLLPDIVYHLDEPFGDLLCLPVYVLARKAKEQLTVVLTGDGADEIFNGYFHQKVMSIWQKFNLFFRVPGMGRLLSFVIRFVPPAIINLFFDYPDEMKSYEKRKLSETLLHSSTFGSFYEGIVSAFTREDKKRLYTTELEKKVSKQPIYKEFDRDIRSFSDFQFFSRLSLLDLKYWIPFSVVYRLDKLNMAHAVENRSPFLDYRLVEMALQLTPKGKLHRSKNKIILRNLIEKYYPAEMREPGKQAFYMPLTDQYRQRYGRWINELLTQEAVEKRGLFRWPAVSELLELLPQDSMLVKRQLTALAMLELWCRIYLDKEIVVPGINND